MCNPQCLAMVFCFIRKAAPKNHPKQSEALCPGAVHAKIKVQRMWALHPIDRSGWLRAAGRSGTKNLQKTVFGNHGTKALLVLVLFVLGLILLCYQ